MNSPKRFLTLAPFELTRFAMISGLTFAVDFCVFSLALRAGLGILVSLVGARLLAILVNLTGVKLFVFRSSEEWKQVVPKFLALCALHTALSYGSIHLLHLWISSILLCRIITDLFLFLGSYLVQRRWIF